MKKLKNLKHQFVALVTMMVLIVNPVLGPVSAVMTIHVWCLEYFLPLVGRIGSWMLGLDAEPPPQGQTVYVDFRQGISACKDRWCQAEPFRHGRVEGLLAERRLKLDGVLFLEGKAV